MNVTNLVPGELKAGRLLRLGEGIGKVVYASEHWVVKRERSPREIVALIAIWKGIRRVEHLLPWGIGRRQIRLLRVALQGVLLVIPKTVWLSTHMGAMWRSYRKRDLRGARLAQEHLTDLMPARIEFPPTRVRVGGWPGWLTVCEAVERVEATLYQRLYELAMRGEFEEVERWLDRFLELRESGWSRGIFSVDAHLKNFGVIGERVVLIDPGGLTTEWEEIEGRLAFEEVLTEPHIQLGLGPVLGAQPELAARFNARWKQRVNREQVARILGVKTSASARTE